MSLQGRFRYNWHSSHERTFGLASFRWKSSWQGMQIAATRTTRYCRRCNGRPKSRAIADSYILLFLRPVAVPHCGRGAQASPKSWLAPKFSGPPNLSVLLIHRVHLILRNISKFDATRCHILSIKCTKFDFRWGSAPDPAAGAYCAPQTLAVFMRAFF